MKVPPVKFLLVDDLDSNLVALEALLRREGLDLLLAHSGPAALEVLLEHEVDLALLDVNMPGMDGFQLAEFMRGTERTRSIPIIFITAGSPHAQPHFRGYELGAVDFLFKPIEPHALLSKTGVFFQLAQQRQELRRLAEEHARQGAAHAAAEQFLRTMLDGAFDLIYAQDPQGRIVFANASATRAWRHAPNVRAGSGEEEGWPLGPAAAHQLSALNANVLQTGLPQRGEIEALVEGKKTIYWVDKAPVRPSDGQTVGVVTVAKDLTELRDSQIRVSQQLAEIESLYECAPLGMCVLDRDLRFVRINGRLVEMDGMPAADHLGRTVAEVVPGLLATTSRLAQQVLRTGLPVGNEVRGVTQAQPGVQRVWDAALYPLKDSTGTVFAIGVMVDDITERRKIEAGLRDSEEQFRALAENIPHLAWMCDPAGNIFWYNQRWLDFTGTKLEEVRNMGWLRCHHPEHKDRVLAAFRKAVASGVPFEETFPLRGADGIYRWFLTRAFPLRNTEGTIVRWFGTNTDVTVLRETQQALRDAEKTVRQYAQSLEATVEERTATLRTAVAELEAFSYSLAHDLRAPLRTMAGYVDVISQENPGLDATTQHYLDRIRTGAKRLDRMTQEMLSYARLRESLPLEKVCIAGLLADLIDTYPNLRVARDCIHVDLPLPQVVGNTAALTQVLSNLVGNALKFVEPGCAPEVKVWGEVVSELPGMSGSSNPWARICIEDKGIGVAPEARQRLFQLFQRLNPPGKYDGFGMGLAMAHKAVERMNGRIGYEPLSPRGSRFWLALHSPPEDHAPPATIRTRHDDN